MIHFLIVYKTYRLAVAAIFQSFFDLLDQRGRDVVVDVYFGVAGDLEYPGVVRVVSEIGEDVPEIVADDVLQ